MCENFRIFIKTIQPSDLRRSQDDDAVDARTVPSFREKHGVAEDVVFSGLEVCKDLCSVFALAIHFRRPEAPVVQNIPELLRCGYEGKEDDCFPIHAVFRHLVCNLIKIRIERRSDLSYLVIAGRNPHLRDIQLERNGKRLDLAEISLLNGLRNTVFIGQGIEYLAEVLHISAIGRCCNSEDFRLVEVIKDIPV